MADIGTYQQEEVTEIIAGVWPFIIVNLIVLLLVTYVPWLSTWLPTLLMGPEVIIK